MLMRGVVALALVLNVAASVQAASAVRVSSFEYEAVTGLLTKETIEPDSANLCLATRYLYDSRGNKISATTENCAGATGDALIETRSSTTDFNVGTSRFRFPASATNALGHSETRVYDEATGNVTSLIGPNSLSTTWEYDALGRKKKETRADGTVTEWDYLFCSGVAGGSAACPPNGKYLVRTTPKANGAQSGPITTVYFDALNREVRAETQGFNQGVAVFKDTEYDTVGRVSRVSRPYYVNQTVHWTTFEYDALGRLTGEIQPATTTQAGTLHTTTEYNGLTVTVTVSNAGAGANLPESVRQQRTTVRNSQGQTVSVTDSAGHATTYAYDPFGNLRVTTAGGINTVLEYDVRGRKTRMIDPDMGTWTYAYDALGQLKRQTDARQQASTLTYDKLGRMTSRSEPDLISTWSYDTCTTGKGKLCAGSSANDYSRTYTYDALGRTSGISTLIEATTYAINYTYDSSGRLSETRYPQGASPTRFVTKNEYHATLGYLERVTNGAGLTYWQATSVSATGRMLNEALGNGLSVTRTYDELDRLKTSAVGSLQTFGYTYDTIGNMTQRVDASQNNLTENFVYDRLNRLKQSSGSGLTTRSYEYDAVGNIKHKSDVGAYNYPTAGNLRPHAVQSITGTVNGITNPTFTYDENGNMTAGLGRAVTYTSFNMPASITGAGYTYAYTYNADHERVRLEHSTLGTFIYLHPDGKGRLLYEKETKGSVVQHKYYINAGGSLVGVQLESSTTSELRYFHTDHLGSITLITNASGGQVERLAYEAFGKRRHVNGTDDSQNTIFGITTDRGFTGHEHLDEITLIHMNGRVYDPVLARFISADPFVQSPDNLQDYNRYAYVLNNPLAYTDPSGSLKIGPIKISSKTVKMIVIAAVSWYAGGLVANSFIGSAANTAAAAGLGGGTTFSTAFATVGGALEAGTLTALGSAVSGAAAGFTGGFLASGGDFEFALKSGVAVGLTAGLGQFGLEFAGTPGGIAGRSLGSGLSTQAFGGSMAEGLKNGLLGAIRSEAYAYMQEQTDKLALAAWQGELSYDEFGRPWTYGNRRCADGSGTNCSTWFPQRLLMATEDKSFAQGLFTTRPLFGGGVGETALLGTFLNSISKVHDWMNQVLTGVYDANIGSPTYGSALPGSAWRGTVIDTISTAAMLPAAAFTARALYNSPLKVK